MGLDRITDIISVVLPRMKNVPLISVIIVSHDRKQFLREAILSVTNQSLKREEYEVIVVMNFSDPEIEEFIRLHECISLHDTSFSFAEKISSALMIASGEVIATLDDDDTFEPRKLEVIRTIFMSNPSLLYLHHSHFTLRENRKLDSPIYNPPSSVLRFNTREFNKNLLSKFMLATPYFNGSSIIFRRTIADNELFSSGRITGGWDSIIFLLALDRDGVLMDIPDKLTVYRVHDSTSTKFLKFSSFIPSKRAWYEKYSDSIASSNNESLTSILSKKVASCLIKESKINFTLVSEERIEFKDVFGLAVSFLECRSYFPKPRYLFLLLDLIIYTYFPKVAKILYFISHKVRFIS